MKELRDPDLRAICDGFDEMVAVDVRRHKSHEELVDLSQPIFGAWQSFVERRVMPFCVERGLNPDLFGQQYIGDMDKHESEIAFPFDTIGRLAITSRGVVGVQERVAYFSRLSQAADHYPTVNGRRVILKGLGKMERNLFTTMNFWPDEAAKRNLGWKTYSLLVDVNDKARKELPRKSSKLLANERFERLIAEVSHQMLGGNGIPAMMTLVDTLAKSEQMTNPKQF